MAERGRPKTVKVASWGQCMPFWGRRLIAVSVSSEILHKFQRPNPVDKWCMKFSMAAQQKLISIKQLSAFCGAFFRENVARHLSSMWEGNPSEMSCSRRRRSSRRRRYRQLPQNVSQTFIEEASQASLASHLECETEHRHRRYIYSYRYMLSYRYIRTWYMDDLLRIIDAPVCLFLIN